MDYDMDNTTMTSSEGLESKNITSLNCLPNKSKDVYERTYTEFVSWCKAKEVTSYSESVLLEYFTYIAERGLIGSLFPKYSMLKATLNIKEKYDISEFNELLNFIKSKVEGYVPKKTKVLEKEQIQKFISLAPNRTYLMMKIAMMFGIGGALRKDEMLKLETGDVQDLGSKFLVTIRSSKGNRIFTILDNNENTLLDLIRRYIKLRPIHTRHKRFFIFYKDNRCSTQPVGVNTFSKLPSHIATFLKLDKPYLYTGHCFRRSSTSGSIITDASVDFYGVTRSSGYKTRKSTRMAEDYSENSIQNKITENIFSNNLIDVPQTSSTSSETQDSITNIQENNTFIKLEVDEETNDSLSTPFLNFGNCNNFAPENSNGNSKKRNDYINWDEYFMATAFLAAKRSKDPVTQVGACIVNEDKKIIGVGYNGMPNGCDDDEFSWGKDSDEPLDNKYLYVCHAEMNAILNKNTADVKNCTMYVALFPCNECAKFIIQSGIKEVIFMSDKYAHKLSTMASKRMFDAAGIKYRAFVPTFKKLEINFDEINWSNMNQEPPTPIKRSSTPETEFQ